MFTPTMLQRLRQDTPGANNVLHFNNAGAALPPRPVVEAMTAHLELEAHLGGYEAAAAKREDIQAFYTSLATLLNTQSKNIAYTPSASFSFNAALSAIPFERGDVIVTTLNDYVSNQIAFLQLQQRFGIRIQHAADQHSGGVDLEDMAKQIQRHRPKLVAVTHIPTNSGLIQEVEAVGKICREQGIWYLVDGCQSAGQVPVDVEAMGCDFYTASMRKFLRGPRGAGFLYVSDRVLDAGLEPLFMDLHSANWPSNHTYKAKPTAQRFELWERSYVNLLGSAAAIQYALDIGVETLSARLCHLAVKAREQFSALPGIRVLDKGDKLGGIVTLAIAGWQPTALHQALQAQNINTSIAYHESARFDFEEKGVEWALRVSPHYYNTGEEIEQVVLALKSL
ncbi:MAG: aminotransferase class V-fold PLP-dependent enzyme [Bacteroidota bacterium]